MSKQCDNVNRFTHEPTVNKKGTPRVISAKAKCRFREGETSAK